MTEPSLEEQVRPLQAQLAAGNARISCLESEAVHPSEAYSGTEMIQVLLKSAHEDLTDGQLKQLTGFLSLIHQRQPIGATDFQPSASKLLGDFYAAEPVLPGKPQDELVRPGRLPSAIVGLVMYCPRSQNKSSNDFFDYQNPILKMLMDKGITASNSYGFNWHWRSEPHERHRKCPARNYSVELRSIHEIMTCDSPGLLGFAGLT